MLDEFKKEISLYDQNTYLTRSEVSKLLKISLPTLRKNVARGIIPEVKIAGRVLYNLGELKKALKEIQD